MKKAMQKLSLAMLFVTGLSHGGSQAQQEAKFAPEHISSFAKSVEKYAAQQGARAFIIARVGRPVDELPDGIHYTHTAIAVYSNITLSSGEQVKGYAIHNLYQKSDEKDTSVLLTDYPVDFFWGAQELKAGIIIPTPQMQQQLIEVIVSGGNARLHNEQYSVIANPFNSQFQNCTEHTLDIINSAIYQTTDVDRLKANTRAYFSPQRVSTSRFKLLLGSMFMEDVTTSDHKGKIYTTTFTSIADYLQQYQLSETAINFYQDGTVVNI